jgi:hypothetical protein
VTTDREFRLRQRIDTLIDERDEARAELVEVKEDIRVARSVAAKAGPDAGAHAWLAEYDRRREARRAKRRRVAA